MWLSTVAFSVTLTLGLFLAPDPSHAQVVAKTPRIGILTRAFDPNAPSSRVEAFRQGLASQAREILGGDLAVSVRSRHDSKPRNPPTHVGTAILRYQGVAKAASNSRVPLPQKPLCRNMMK